MSETQQSKMPSTCTICGGKAWRGVMVTCDNCYGAGGFAPMFDTPRTVGDWTNCPRCSGTGQLEKAPTCECEIDNPT